MRDHAEVQPPRGYTVRPATTEDLGLVMEMMGAADQVDWGEPDFTESMLLQDWRLPRLDMTKDTWLVLDDEGWAAGYAWLYEREDHTKLDGWGLVHPGHRGRGIGTYLVDRIEARARQHAKQAPPESEVLLTLGVPAPDPHARELHERRGYDAVRHFWRMDVTVEGEVPKAEAPAGMRMRPFGGEADERAVHAGLEEAFAHHRGHVYRSFEEWRGMWIEDEAFDPTLWLLVEEGDELAGALLGQILDGVGWVSTLGVRSPWRGGVGQALLRRSFGLFRDRGIEKVSLFVDAQNATRATALYEKVGMRVARQYDFCQRRIT
jgi:mycothiol synthase